MAQYPARTANNAAKMRLIEEYPERYRQLQAEEYERLGIELPKTAAEKAQEKVSELLGQFPELRVPAVLEAETRDSEAAYEAERDTGAPAAPAPNDPGIDDAELPEGHEFFGSN